MLSPGLVEALTLVMVGTLEGAAGPEPEKFTATKKSKTTAIHTPRHHASFALITTLPFFTKLFSSLNSFFCYHYKL